MPMPAFAPVLSLDGARVGIGLAVKMGVEAEVLIETRSESAGSNEVGGVVGFVDDFGEDDLGDGPTIPIVIPATKSARLNRPLPLEQQSVELLKQQ
jgi:hypothetical protein